MSEKPLHALDCSAAPDALHSAPSRVPTRQRNAACVGQSPRKSRLPMGAPAVRRMS
jgi:hypothetical protein